VELSGAVILAGGRNRPDMVAATGREYRALIPLGGQSLLSRVLTAVAATPNVAKIAVAGPEAVQREVPDDPSVARVTAEGTFADNLLAGVEALGMDGYALVVPADMPMVTPEALENLLARAWESGADLVYPIIERRVTEAAYPGTKRLYVRLREGAFTSGNAVALRPSFLRGHHALLDRLYDGRKSPIALASLLGVAILARMITGRLSVAQVERRANEVVGGRVMALPMPYAELGFDVDKLSDLKAAEAFLRA